MLKVLLNVKVLSSILLIVHITFCMEENPIIVVRSGMEPIEKDDTSIKFFVTAQNRGRQSAVVGLEMKKCCQHITTNDTDCESMSLQNGLRLEFHPGDKMNLTMFYTNRYLYGRKGDCWLKLKWRQESKGSSAVEVQIPFDTQAILLTPLQKLISSLTGLNEICDSVDEDPARGCLPVNCLLKYSGFRSFFNRTRRRCQSSPTCHGRPFTTDMEKRPDTVVSTISNRCKLVKRKAQFNEVMRELQDITEVAALSYTKYPIIVKCVHGHRNDSGELCICDTGWASRNFSAKNFNPEIDIYVKCDLAVGPARSMKASTSLIILIGMLVLLALVLCFYIPWAFRRHSKLKEIDSMTSELADSNSSSSDTESTIAPSVKSSRRGKSPTSASTKTKMMEFSPLLRTEQTTRPSQDESRRAISSEGTKRLSYPDSFQLKPQPATSVPPSQSPSSCYPSSMSTSSTLASLLPASCHETALKEQWSIPDTTESLASSSRFVPLTSSRSADAFPRQTDICACLDETPKPLVSVRVHTDDPNRNTIVTVSKFSASETSLVFENVLFPGKSPQCITETATNHWKKELDTFLLTFKADDDKSVPPSTASSTLTTLSEFWKEDEGRKNSKSSKRSQELWLQSLFDSTNPRD